MEAIIRQKFEALSPRLDERSRRLWAGAEARALGYGGVSTVARATGMSRNTVKAGLRDLEHDDLDPSRVRRSGAGRKSRTEEQPTLLHALERLSDRVTRGDPESPLRWTTQSTEKLANALKAQGYKVSSSTVWRRLRELGYRLQSTKKTLERRHHDDRDAEFIFINGAVQDFQEAGDPAISVETKKKERVGEFHNNGREWHPSGKPPLALPHDVPSDASGRAIPSGVFDIERNEALVNVGVDHDASAFAVESIRRWWRHLGQQAYPESRQLLITADAGGSTGYRRRAWKTALQRFSNETGLTITVVHFPPGTSKWNKIEHRLFCHLSENWLGRPLYNYATVIQRIGSTRTKTGLEVKALLDSGEYPTGIKVQQHDLDAVNIVRFDWHGEWNYSVAPSAS